MSGATQRVRLLQYCIEDRGEVAGRGIDDLQYLCGRGLLLQSLARLGQQPRVLHCNDRLRREILQKCDLLVGEGANFLAIDVDRPKHRPFFDQRHRESRARSGEINQHLPVGIAASVKFIILRIESMDNRFACEDACHNASRCRRSRAPSNLGKGGRLLPARQQRAPARLRQR